MSTDAQLGSAHAQGNQSLPFTLSSVLGGMSAEAFRTAYWQTQPYYCHRGNRAFFDSLFRVDDLDQLLATIDSSGEDPGVRFVRSTPEDRFGEVQPKGRGRRFASSEVYQLYSEGYTLAIHYLEWRWPPIARLCRDLVAVFGAKVTAGLYMTPGGSQGLAPHFDSHDVIVLQLSGTKRWTLYERVQTLGDGPVLDPSVRPTQTIDLTPGDALYVPRYFGHEAKASRPDQSSLHLTVAIHPVAVVDVLLAALKEVAKTSQVLQNVCDNALSRQSVVDMIASVVTDDLLARAAQSLRDTRCDELDAIPDGHFRSLNRINELTDDTHLRRRHTHAEVRSHGELCEVCFPGNRVLAPSACLSAMRYAASTDMFAVRSMPGMGSSESRIVLARRLVIAGLLAMV